MTTTTSSPDPLDAIIQHPVLTDMAESDGRPHEMTQNQIVSVREHMNANFWDFCVTIGGCDIMYAPVHRTVCTMMEKWGQDGWRRLIAQLPRSSLKSTILTRNGALWQACRDPNTTIIVINEKVERVESWFLAIQSIVAGNPMFHALYGDIIPPGISHQDTRSKPRDWVWSSRKMNFIRTKTGIPEPTFTAMGYSSAYTGGHWDWCYLDDLISEEARDSGIVMQASKDRFDTLQYIGPTPARWNAFIPCTRWTFDDVYRYAVETHGFKLYRRSALEGQKSIWEERWPTASLLGEQERNPVSFSCQMQNNPMPGKDLAFQPTWVRAGNVVPDEWGQLGFKIDDASFDRTITVDPDLDEEPPQFVPLNHLTKVLLVDPAPTKESDRKRNPTSRTAMVMKGIDAWGRRYWLDLWAGREEPVTELRQMFAMLQKWGTDRIAVEEVNFSILYAPWLKYMGPREFGMTIRYVPLLTKGRDKDQRIFGKRNSFQNGFEYVNEPIRGPMMDEYMSFPYGQTRDILDAAAYDQDPGVLPRPASPDEREYALAMDEWRKSDEGGRDEVTGY
jgi:hypothetical protein